MNNSCIHILAIAAFVLLPTLTYAEAVRFQNSPPSQLLANPPAEAGVAVPAPLPATEPAVGGTDWSAYSVEAIIKRVRDSQLEVQLQHRIADLRPAFLYTLEADEFAARLAAYRLRQENELREAPEVSTDSRPLNKTRLIKQHAAENRRLNESHEAQRGYAEAQRRVAAEGWRKFAYYGGMATFFSSTLFTSLLILEAFHRGADFALVIANQL